MVKTILCRSYCNLGKQKINNIHVICPGFSSDCLETLEEINMEGKSIFINNGGKNYKYIPALNSDPHWIEAMGIISSQICRMARS